MANFQRLARGAACSLVLAAPCLLGAADVVPAQPLRLTPEELAARKAEAGQDPVALLRLVPLAGEDSARSLRRRVFELLTARKANAPAADLDALAARMAAVLPQTVHSPAEAREVLGPPREISREVLYRRYLEEWAYDRPLALYLVFDCRTGELPRLQSVHVNRPQKL